MATELEETGAYAFFEDNKVFDLEFRMDAHLNYMGITQFPIKFWINSFFFVK